MNTSSPCVDICKLDMRGICLGCFRTKDEIARWMQMKDNEKFSVNVLLEDRRKKYAQVFSVEQS